MNSTLERAMQVPTYLELSKQANIIISWVLMIYEIKH